MAGYFPKSKTTPNQDLMFYHMKLDGILRHSVYSECLKSISVFELFKEFEQKFTKRDII